MGGYFNRNSNAFEETSLATGLVCGFNGQIYGNFRADALA
jgi:hypothetical protein